MRLIDKSYAYVVFDGARVCIYGLCVCSLTWFQIKIFGISINYIFPFPCNDLPRLALRKFEALVNPPPCAIADNRLHNLTANTAVSTWAL